MAVCQLIATHVYTLFSPAHTYHLDVCHNTNRSKHLLVLKSYIKQQKNKSVSCVSSSLSHFLTLLITLLGLYQRNYNCFHKQ